MDDYECMDCQADAIGSFLEIRRDAGEKLTICDIKAYGEFLTERGFFLFFFFLLSQFR